MFKVILKTGSINDILLSVLLIVLSTCIIVTTVVLRNNKRIKKFGSLDICLFVVLVACIVAYGMVIMASFRP